MVDVWHWMHKDVTVGVEQASNEDPAAVQGLGHDSNGTYNEALDKDGLLPMGRPE